MQGYGDAAGPGAISHSLMLQINEQLVLDFVRERGRSDRTEITERLGLSAATVSRIVRRLAAAGFVSEEPGTSTRGRPRTVVSFNPRSGCVIGIDLGGTKCHGYLADLDGGVLAEETEPTNERGQPFATLVEILARLRHRADSGLIPLTAATVGVPAIVDARTGVAIGGPNVSWDGFPIVSAVSQHLDVPFIVENDVNLAALGHAWRGDARGVPDFAVMNFGTGIGAAIVVDGRLLRGHGSSAGEIGYMVLDRGQLRAARPGQLGAFETLTSGPAISLLAEQALRSDRRHSTLRQPDHVPTSAEVFAAAAIGDAIAGGVVDALVDHVAMGIIALASVTDPEVVILDGAVGRALEGVVVSIQGLVDRHVATPPRVVVSTLGQDATALGAVAAALDLSRASRRSGTPPSAAGPRLTRIPQELTA